MTRLVLFVAGKSLGSGPRAHDMARRRLRRLEASGAAADEAE
jgi:hypothetical protein